MAGKVPPDLRQRVPLEKVKADLVKRGRLRYGVEPKPSARKSPPNNLLAGGRESLAQNRRTAGCKKLKAIETGGESEWAIGEPFP